VLLEKEKKGSGVAEAAGVIKYFLGCNSLFPDTGDFGSRNRRYYIFCRESSRRTILNPACNRRIYFHQPLWIPLTVSPDSS
jgi:hypothetical protein